jgi:hypothetical protein
MSAGKRRRVAKTKIKGKFFELTAQGSPDFIRRVLASLPMLDGDDEDAPSSGIEATGGVSKREASEDAKDS